MPTGIDWHIINEQLANKSVEVMKKMAKILQICGKTFFKKFNKIGGLK